MPPKELVPVVPEWCDCTLRNSNPKQSATFLGVCRALVAILSFALCIAFSVTANSVRYDPSLTPEDVRIVDAILIVICVINIIHLFASVYLIYIVQKNRIDSPLLVKRWVIADFVITSIYIVFIIVLLTIIPSKKLYIILGAKLMFLSLFICYRSWWTSKLFTNEIQHQRVIEVAVEGQPSNQPVYANVYKV